MIEKHIPLDSYKLNVLGLAIHVNIFLDRDGIGHYYISILNISKVTTMILRKIREEFISKMNIGSMSDDSESSEENIKKVFQKEILFLIKKYFPNIDKKTTTLLFNYLVRQNIGLGDIDIFLKDANLEELVINSSSDPIRIYHRKYQFRSYTNYYI